MYIKRAVADEIKEYMKSFPVLLISGARQVGKSTLALNLDIPNYVTLDDINIYESARNDPKGFIEHCSKPIVIDEIQRVPILLLAIKEFVDKNRTNGQFILTGSANLKGFKDISIRYHTINLLIVHDWKNADFIFQHQVNRIF